MAALFGFFAGGNDRASKPKYSIEHLQQLYNKLQHIKDADADQSRESMVEVIREITEALIWGEQNDHDHNFFDFFCEKNILADFVNVLGKSYIPKTVKVQLLQTLSMLVQNIRRETSLYYLFSNNYVNQLISTQFDWSDEEILGYYISFLKSLALRLNFETIKFFFNERAEQFPLYVEAVRFCGHRDNMVRTAVRTLTLQVFGIQDPAMQKFVLERSSQTYFVHLACYWRELWVQLDAAARAAAASSNDQSLSTIQELNEQQQDLLIYLADVLELENAALREALADRLLHYALLPVLIGSLIPLPEGESAESSSETNGASEKLTVSPTCALFILHQVFDTFRSRVVLEPLMKALMRPRVSSATIGAWQRLPPPCPSTYRATHFDVCGPSSIEEAGPDSSSPAVSSTAPEPSAAEVENPARADLLSRIASSPADMCVLLAAGILRACISRRDFVPQDLFQECHLLPYASLRKGDRKHATDGDEEVLLLVLRALERHTLLRVVVVQVLVQLSIDLAGLPAGMSSFCPAEIPVLSPVVQAERLRTAQRALQSGACNVRSYLNGALSDNFLDIFSEEWEQDAAPHVSIREVCSNIRCLVPATPGSPSSSASENWSIPAPHAERQHAAKAVRCLLLIRRLLSEMSEKGAAAEDVPSMPSPLPPPAPGAEALSPLGLQAGLMRLDEEAKDAYQEGKSFELGRQDRIVCGVVTQEGRHTRYLVLHPFLLLLVQPDLVQPGWAVVRTLCPVRVVEPVVDRSDPRTLRLCIRLPKGVPCPGEAAPLDPSSSDPSFRLAAEEHRGSSFSMLTLSFEDVKRCHGAEAHLRRSRKQVRQKLRERVEAFIEELCAAPGGYELAS